MTTTPAAVLHGSLLRTALRRFADRLGNAAKARTRAPVADSVDKRALADLSDHVLRDIGFVRDLGPRIHSAFPRN
jgi:Domain of unknown function (DUF1127)